jgi:PDZ domain-containing protein
VYRVLYGWLHPEIDVRPEDEIRGKESAADERILDTTLMDQSQDIAKVVALQHLGYDARLVPLGALVFGIIPEGAAQGDLRLGDLVVAVDGTSVTTAEEVGPLVRVHPPGDTTIFTVLRGDARIDVPVVLGERDGEAFAGIFTRTLFEVDTPVEIVLDTGTVQGPSAGLAFTLAIIDQMSPGDLTGGKLVAVTGEIFPDGTVGPVGGVRQKILTAENAGADLMLVPQAELEQARAWSGGLRIVGVETVDDALAALEAAGGAPVETSTPTTVAA